MVFVGFWRCPKTGMNRYKPLGKLVNRYGRFWQILSQAGIQSGSAYKGWYGGRPNKIEIWRA